MMTTGTVTFVGAGGVAWSMAQALARSMTVSQVFSRDMANASALAALTGAEAVDSPEAIRPGAGVYIIAVADHALTGVVARLNPDPSAVWAITSGSADPQMLSRLGPDYGVVYPLQTFTRGLTVDFTDVPVFVDGSTDTARQRLMELARRLSRVVHPADAALRQRLHIAGVLTCNFVNYLWGVADDLLREQGLTLDVVRPLIAETLEKTARMRPRQAQTGPARRADMDVMRTHMAGLSPDDAELYRMISQRIINLYHTPDESHQL